MKCQEEEKKRKGNRKTDRGERKEGRKEGRKEERKEERKNISVTHHFLFLSPLLFFLILSQLLLIYLEFRKYETVSVIL